MIYTTELHVLFPSNFGPNSPAWHSYFYGISTFWLYPNAYCSLLRTPITNYFLRTIESISPNLTLLQNRAQIHFKLLPSGNFLRILSSLVLSQHLVCVTQSRTSSHFTLALLNSHSTCNYILHLTLFY